jgi:hypothetical protein
MYFYYVSINDSIKYNYNIKVPKIRTSMADSIFSTPSRKPAAHDGNADKKCQRTRSIAIDEI